MVCRQGWEGANIGVHEWVQGLMAAFQEAQDQERQARPDHTFQATGGSQQTLMGTHVIKALQVTPPLPFSGCPSDDSSCSPHAVLEQFLLHCCMLVRSSKAAKFLCPVRVGLVSSLHLSCILQVAVFSLNC